MPKDLTAADQVDFLVTYKDRSRPAVTVHAAYVATDNQHPDMLAFKDHEHHIVRLVARDLVAEVERQDPPPQQPAGFRPTTQILEARDRRP